MESEGDTIWGKRNGLDFQYDTAQFWLKSSLEYIELLEKKLTETEDKLRIAEKSAEVTVKEKIEKAKNSRVKRSNFISL